MSRKHEGIPICEKCYRPLTVLDNGIFTCKACSAKKNPCPKCKKCGYPQSYDFIKNEWYCYTCDGSRGPIKIPKKEMTTCYWEWDQSFNGDIFYETDCGNTYGPMKTPLLESGYEFCPFCGKKIFAPEEV